MPPLCHASTHTIPICLVPGRRARISVFDRFFSRQLYNQIQFARNWDYAALQCVIGLLSMQRRSGRRNMSTLRLSDPLKLSEPERASER